MTVSGRGSHPWRLVDITHGAFAQMPWPGPRGTDGGVWGRARKCEFVTRLPSAWEAVPRPPALPWQPGLVLGRSRGPSVGSRASRARSPRGGERAAPKSV